MKDSRPRRVGLPRIHAERGEKRDFLPAFVRFLLRLGVEEVVMEEGYGSGMAIAPHRYTRFGPRVRFASFAETLQQDLVLVLRDPGDDVVHDLRPGTLLVSMLHFPTRPDRVHLLTEYGVSAISLDCVVDDQERRLVENLRAVGWNGMREAFRVLRQQYPGRAFASPERPPIRVTVLGAGAVGSHAVHAATRYGDLELRAEMVRNAVPGVAVTVVDHDLTRDENFMRSCLQETDILADATQRPDPSRPVVPNAWIGDLPEHAVLVDLSVDPYALDRTPPSVKGLEGVPGGDLDQWIFPAHDPAFDRIDRRVDTTHRRTSISCHAWPGITPLECMTVYGSQIQPVMRVLFDTPAAELDVDQGTHFERAVARAELGRWRAAHRA